MKNPFGQIVSFEDYVDIIGIPKEQLNSEEVKNRINKWLVQATEQFDSMISGNGQLGRLYRWFEALQDNEEDNYKKYKLIKAICSWVETFVIKGKFWVDGLPVINSNVDIQINSSSTDSNVEAKRKDIIQDLVSVGLYQTTNFGDNNTYQDNQQSAEQLIEDLIVLSTSELQQNYLRLNPQKSLEGNLDFANNDLVNGGNIIGSTQQARNNIQYYNIIDSTIDLNRNTIIGSLPQDPTTAADIAQINQNIANINQEQITQNTNISNNANEINALKAKDIEQNNRLTQLEQETEDNFNEITSIKTKDQQQDTLIQGNTTSINANTNSINTLNQQVANNKNLLDQTIDGLRTLKPFEYVGEYQNGTSYKTNQLVSLNNNLYLSKEDNNNTTPPSDKWLLLDKDFASIDLNDYYTKLEVDTIKSNLQNDITSNTNSITTLTQTVGNNTNNITNIAKVQNQHDQWINENKTNIASNTTNITINKNNIDKLNNEVVKLAGNQNITGQKTFTKGGEAIRINPGATGSAYIMGYNDTTKKWAMGCNGSNDFTFEASAGNLILKAPKGFINASKVRISNLGEPTTLTDATTKAYVDNAIKNASLGGGTSGGGTTIPSDLINRVDQLEQTTTTNTNDINDLETKYNQQQTTIEQNKNDITNKVNQVEQNVNTNTSSITDLNNKYTQQQTLINTNKTNIETNKNTINNVNQNLTSTQNLLTQTINELRTLRPFKYVGAYNSSTTYKINEMVSYNNAFYLSVEDNNNTTPSTTNNKWIVMENFQQVDLTNYATKLELNDTKTTLQNNITTNRSDIADLQINAVKINTDQTISGTKTFNTKIRAQQGLITNTNGTITSGNLELGYGGTFAYITSDSQDAKSLKFSGKSGKGKLDLDMGGASKITNLPDPINIQDAATKYYVDNKTTNSTLYRQVYFSSTTYSTNQTTNITISNYVNSNSAAFQSWMIQFDRQGQNGNSYEGTFNLNFLLPDINKATFVDSSYYFNSSNQKFQDGGKVGITIHRISSTQLKLTFQLWDGSNRIKNVKVFAPPA